MTRFDFQLRVIVISYMYSVYVYRIWTCAGGIDLLTLNPIIENCVEKNMEKCYRFSKIYSG